MVVIKWREARMRSSAVPLVSWRFQNDSPGKTLVDKKEERGGFSKDNQSHEKWDTSSW